MLKKEILLSDFDNCIYVPGDNIEDIIYKIIKLNEIYRVIIATGKNKSLFESFIKVEKIEKYIEGIVFDNGSHIEILQGERKKKKFYFSNADIKKFNGLIKNEGISLENTLGEVLEEDFSNVMRIKCRIDPNDFLNQSLVLNTASALCFSLNFRDELEDGKLVICLYPKGVNKFKTATSIFNVGEGMVNVVGDGTNDISLMANGSNRFVIGEKLIGKRLKNIEELFTENRRICSD